MGNEAMEFRVALVALGALWLWWLLATGFVSFRRARALWQVSRQRDLRAREMLPGYRGSYLAGWQLGFANKSLARLVPPSVTLRLAALRGWRDGQQARRVVCAQDSQAQDSLQPARK